MSTAWLEPTARIADRTGTTFGPAHDITTADPFEKAWWTGLDRDANAVVVTVRKHLPTQRIRAILVPHGAKQQGPVTISDRHHSASGPRLDVAPDGTAVAAWQWHDTDGWKVQAAVRKPGAARFGAPQTLSPADPDTAGRVQPRPIFTVAAGEGGRAAIAWQFTGESRGDDVDLHVRTAGTDGVFGADQVLKGGGKDVQSALALAPDGAVQLAWLEYSYKEGVPTHLHVAQGRAGAPLGAPQVLSTGGSGTSSGTQLAVAFDGTGAATVAWAKPGADYEQGGDVEVFTRPADGAFGPAQVIGAKGEGVTLAAGRDGRAVVAYMTSTTLPDHLQWAVHAAVRPAAGQPFAPEQVISDPNHSDLWPSVAVGEDGALIATWTVNDNGGGGGQVGGAIATP